MSSVLAFSLLNISSLVVLFVGGPFSSVLIRLSICSSDFSSLPDVAADDADDDESDDDADVTDAGDPGAAPVFAGVSVGVVMAAVISSVVISLPFGSKASPSMYRSSKTSTSSRIGGGNCSSLLFNASGGGVIVASVVAALTRCSRVTFFAVSLVLAILYDFYGLVCAEVPGRLKDFSIGVFAAFLWLSSHLVGRVLFFLHFPFFQFLFV